MTTLSHNHALSISAATAGAVSVAVGDDLLRRLRSRDLSALADLTERYGAALTRIAYLQLGDAHVAEDVAQDTLLAAWDGVGRTSETTVIWPWLLGITCNRCRKHWRFLSRRNRREKVAFELRLSGLDEEKSKRDSQRLTQVQVALGDLSSRLRIVVILRYFEGLSVRETADALAIPEGTVKRRCHVAIDKLRAQLTEVSS